MGQRPIAVRLNVPSGGSHNGRMEEGESVIVGVTEAARLMGVSERTVYRLLQSGKLERVNGVDLSDIASINVRHEKNASLTNPVAKSQFNLGGRIFMSDSHVGHDEVEALKQQLQEKDRQIGELRLAQQELTGTIQRLQDQMYELAHLVLTQNVAAAQAKAEAEIKAQEQAQPGRRGLASLLGGRGKRS